MHQPTAAGAQLAPPSTTTMAPPPSTVLPYCRLDKDCLITIFEYLSMAEKLKCRLVSEQWKGAVDKLIAGQQYLEVHAVNSSLAAAAVEATGVSAYPTTGANLSMNSALRGIKQVWTSVNAKLMPASGAEEAALENGGAGPVRLAAVAAQTHPPAHPRHLASPNESEVLNLCSASNLVSLSAYYWTYAFCASSSLFSSYSFANSSITSHEYFHSFCDCYPRQRHKYSVILDRSSLSFESLNNLLTKFSNVLSLVVRNVDQLSDVMLFTITQQCTKLQSLSFTNCTGLKREKNNQHAPLNCLTDYGWRLLGSAYPALTSLTLRQCKLSEEQLTRVIQSCTHLNFLDISDNEYVGKSVRYLGPSIECLICGDLSNDEAIDAILSNVAFGNGRHVKYLSLFGALGSLKSLVEFTRLSRLELHYYTDEELPNYLYDIGVLSLVSLVLEQIRCYESPSAVNAPQFEQMIHKSPNLRRLQITGDFDWNLRLNDDSLKKLAHYCPQLQELTLNGNGSLTDYGLMHLSNLPLVQLSLSSFHAITDYSIKSLLKKMDTLKQVTLVDMPQITDRVITKAINICVTDESRTIKLTLSDEQMSKRVRRRHIRYPPNLWVNFDSHLCGKQLADTEPTDVQMILVIIMSAIILGMTLLTTVVVVLVPLSMLLMMAHEWLFELLFTRLESVSLFEGLLRLFTSSTAAPTMISSASAASDTGPATFLGGVALSFLRKLLSSVATK